MQLRIHQLVHCVFHVLGGERRAIGEINRRTQHEGDLLAVLGDRPRGRELGFQPLGVAIQTEQHTSSEIANGFRGIVGHGERIEGLGFRAQIKPELIETDGRVEEHGENEANQQRERATLHEETSRSETAIWRLLTIRTSITSGAKRQMSARRDSTVSSSRSKLPNDGKGSATPSPRMLRLASDRMKMGTEIQNCASKTGRRFGITCLHNSQRGATPVDLARMMNSACRMHRARASKIRAGAAQPNSPSTRKVMVTEAAGEVFSGSVARTISNRKSQGIDSTRSMAVFAARSAKPPAKPGIAPMPKASNIETAAAAGASRMEMRLP